MTNSIDFIAYAPRDYKAGREIKTNYTRIGVAFKHRNGPGFNLELDALPVDGRVILFEPEPKEDVTAPETPPEEPVGQ